MSDVYGTPHNLYKTTLLFKANKKGGHTTFISLQGIKLAISYNISGHFLRKTICYNLTKFILQVAARNRRRKG